MSNFRSTNSTIEMKWKIFFKNTTYQNGQKKKQAKLNGRIPIKEIEQI